MRDVISPNQNHMEQNQNAKSGIVKGLAIVVVIGLLLLIAWKLNDKDDAAPITAPRNNDEAMQPAPSVNRKYNNGTYSATGSYVSPAGPEEVDIIITIKDDVVVDAAFMGKATHPTSKKNQDLFGAGFKEQVVGKSIDSISLGVVNGSSLTPKGFMDALIKIKAQAQV